MTGYLLGFVIVILLILSILVVILLKMRNNKQNSEQPLETDISPSILSDFKLPLRIEKMGTRTLLDASIKIYQTFEVLDYANAGEANFEKKEWHTWQVSILLELVKKNVDFFPPIKQNAFHRTVLAYSKDDLISLLKTIENKYINQVNINTSKDNLCKEIIWTSKEVSIILYYLINKGKLA